MKNVFVIAILVWVLIGFLGVLQNARKNSSRINFEMITFFLIIPFIPIIAKWCEVI